MLRWQAVRCIDRHALGWPSDSGALLSEGRALVTLEPREPEGLVAPLSGSCDAVASVASVLEPIRRYHLPPVV